MRCAVGVIDEIKSEILQHCAVGWCCKPCRISNIAKELDESGIRGFSIMRISGSLVLLMFGNGEVRDKILRASYLRRWFNRVEIWTSDLVIENHRAWLEAMQGDDVSVSDSQSESEDLVTPTPVLTAGMPKMTECQSRGFESNGRSVDGNGDSFCSMVPESVLDGDNRW
ncbi:hypothetical protein V6N13_030733 [Hibiscus sabdariffa]